MGTTKSDNIMVGGKKIIYNIFNNTLFIFSSEKFITFRVVLKFRLGLHIWKCNLGTSDNILAKTLKICLKFCGNM